MNHHHPFLKIMCKAAWIITALASINVGLLPFGYNFFNTNFALMHLDRLVIPMHYLILLSGIISFILFVKKCAAGCDTGKHKSSCSC